MIGTQKQIEWANQIIADRLVVANAIATKPGFSGYWALSLVDYPEFNLAALTEMLNEMNDAAEIINNREKSLVELYINHTGWTAPVRPAPATDDPFAL